MKVGFPDAERDLRRVSILREAVGPGVRVMFDANQQRNLPRAIQMGEALKSLSPFWIEEPTHRDDVLGHRTLAEAIAPVSIAIGEHAPSCVMFKNFMQAQAVRYVQVDCTRAGGVSELITVSFHPPEVRPPRGASRRRYATDPPSPGALQQYRAWDERLFLEYIPHLQVYFQEPAIVREGFYLCPERPGSSSDLKVR